MDSNMLKRILIAGAATALDYKDKNPRASTSDAVRHVEKEAKRIIKEIEENE